MKRLLEHNLVTAIENDAEHGLFNVKNFLDEDYLKPETLTYIEKLEDKIANLEYLLEGRDNEIKDLTEKLNAPHIVEPSDDFLFDPPGCFQH